MVRNKSRRNYERLTFDFQALGKYGTTGVASTLKQRDYKDATDLVVSRNESVVHGDDQMQEYIVRRLTPLECCRLQGFPDDWTKDVKGSDSVQYRMWGNGVALPCVAYVMEGISEILREENEIDVRDEQK